MAPRIHPCPDTFVALPSHRLRTVPYVCRIEQVQRNKDQTTKIKFKNAEGKYSTHYFTFAHVLASFKPLTPLT